MEIKLAIGDIAAQQVDAIVVNLFEGVTDAGGRNGRGRPSAGWGHQPTHC